MNDYDVRTMVQVAYVMAQVSVAYAQIEGMKAFNAGREHRGEAPGYPEEAFFAVPIELGLHHNDVLTTLRP